MTMRNKFELNHIFQSQQQSWLLMSIARERENNVLYISKFKGFNGK